MVHANDTATRHEKCTHCNKYWRILFPDVPAEIWLLANHDLEWVRLRPPGAAPRPRVLVSF